MDIDKLNGKALIDKHGYRIYREKKKIKKLKSIPTSYLDLYQFYIYSLNILRRSVDDSFLIFEWNDLHNLILNENELIQFISNCTKIFKKEHSNRMNSLKMTRKHFCDLCKNSFKTNRIDPYIQLIDRYHYYQLCLWNIQVNQKRNLYDIHLTDKSPAIIDEEMTLTLYRNHLERHFNNICHICVNQLLHYIFACFDIYKLSYNHQNDESIFRDLSITF
ncbi:hypothetical protein SNEBB_004657 [Seison nebaliae]|nr:hypothetical protein SNEBB_004657 [Seison nebaliae]